ncbi:MAG: hypothetical protein RBS21_03060, partial [Corynebacterium sp.]|nr:hypothetical protein [Corynebacterium sp.]
MADQLQRSHDNAVLIRTRIPGGIDMAFDHDEYEVNEEQPPPRKRWVTERDEPATNIARARNIAELELSIAVAPSGTDDV